MEKKNLITLAVLIALAVAGYLLYGDKLEQRLAPTSADNAPPGSIHNLPVPEAVKKVRAAAATEFGVSEGLVVVQSAQEREWPDSCLGLAASTEFCLQVITPGYEVKVSYNGKELTYRTNADGSALRKE